jgi:hypothetical protein
MAKLFPPILEKNLPAFAYNPNGATDDEKGKIRIHFENNPAVSMDDYDSVQVLFKTVNENKTGKNRVAQESEGTLNKSNQDIVFKAEEVLNDLGLDRGSYLKVQIAYRKNGVVGYYSDVGIIKCTA